MAIAFGHLVILVDLRRQNVIGPGITKSVLDLGEQNWFGDVAPGEIQQVIDLFSGDEAPQHRAQLDAVLAHPDTPQRAFDVARLFYRILFGNERYQAVDLNGTDAAIKADLNVPVSLEEQFDLVTNLGTGEHVFNQYQFFRTAHERTKPGGLTYHALPHQGAYDHGFYNYHPTFVYDLAEANGYELMLLVYTDRTRPRGQRHLQLHQRADYVRLVTMGQISARGSLHAIFKKPTREQAFRAPFQAYYANTLPADLAAAWATFSR